MRLTGGAAIVDTGAVVLVNAAGVTLDLAGSDETIGSLAGGGATGGTVTNSVATDVTLTTAGNNASTTFAGVIENGAGAIALTKEGTGTFTLAGTNTYSGATHINGGVLSISSDANLGAAPGAPTAGHLSFDGGTLETTASFELNPNRGVALGAAVGRLMSTRLQRLRTTVLLLVLAL